MNLTEYLDLAGKEHAEKTEQAVVRLLMRNGIPPTLEGIQMWEKSYGIDVRIVQKEQGSMRLITVQLLRVIDEEKI